MFSSLHLCFSSLQKHYLLMLGTFVLNQFPLRKIYFCSFNVSTVHASVKGEDENGFFQLLLDSIQMR